MQPPRKSRRWAPVVLPVMLALAMTGCKSAERRAADALALAQYAATAGDLDTAAIELRRALVLRDDNADAWASLGQVEQQRQHLGEAFVAFTRADELKPSDPAILRALCYTAYVVGASKQASDAADRLLAISPGDGTGLSVKALLALDIRDTKTALENVEAIFRTAPQDETGTMLKARAMAVKGDVKGAVALLDEAVARTPKPGGLQALALQLYRLDGDVAGLRATYPKVMAVGESNTDLKADYANFLFKTGETQKAVSVLFDAMIKEQRNGPYLAWAFQILDTYTPRGGATLLDPRVYAASPSLLRTFAARYLVDHDAAASALKLVATSKGIDPADLGIYARALIASGRASDAQAIVDDLLAKPGAKDADALVARSTLALTAKKLERAVIDAQEAVVSDASSVGARLALARAFQARGNDALARDALVDAANDLPHSTLILTALLDFLQKRGDTDGMLSAIRTFADGNTNNPKGWTMLEAICAKQGNSACVETARAKGKAALTNFYMPNPDKPNLERGLFSPIKRPA